MHRVPSDTNHFADLKWQHRGYAVLPDDNWPHGTAGCGRYYLFRPGAEDSFDSADTLSEAAQLIDADKGVGPSS